MGDSGGATANSPSGNVWATATGVKQFAPAPATPAAMNAGAVASAGAGAAHDNMVPFQVVNFIISLFGVFPSQN
jgi:microcystin-dependent protein